MIKSRGFTLLELILVLGMTAVLMASVFLVYLTFFRTWNAGEDRAYLRTQMSLALDEITRDLSKATEVNLINQGKLTFTKEDLGYILYLYNAQDTAGPPAYDKSSYRLMKADAGEAYGGGTVLANGVKPTTVFSRDGNAVIVDLTAVKNDTTVHMRTKIKPRNL